MNPLAISGISVLMSMVSFIVVAALFAWSWLRSRNREQALIWLVGPHMVLRFIGLSFLVPGVVSGSESCVFSGRDWSRYRARHS